MTMIKNYKHTKPKRDWGKSQTLPDQNYTVKELFTRFARGIPVQAARQEPIFLGEENNVDLEKVSKMSIMDKADLSDELLAKAEDIDQQLTEAKAKRSEAKAKAEAEKAQPKPVEAPKDPNQ